MIVSYSPNIQWGKQHVEITLMQWEYAAKFTVDVGGNCTGMSVIECAISTLYDKLAKEGETATVILTDPKGQTLEVEDEAERDEDWLNDMVVKAEIVGWTAPTLNEVRAKNGAEPVEGGERPWQPL